MNTLPNNFSILVKILFVVLLYSSCSSNKAFNESTANHKRIAVIPFESHLKLKDSDKSKLTQQQIVAVELQQSKDVQEAVESYLSNKNLRVSIQSASVTNSKLSSSGIDFSKIQDYDVSKLASILGVDAIVGGSILTEKPMNENTATSIDIAKSLESNLLGTSFTGGINTATNRGTCRLSIFEGKNGDRIWSYSEDISLNKGSTTTDVINKLMKDASSKFPYSSK